MFAKCIYFQTKEDTKLEPLMVKYGQEFYNAKELTVAHSGGISSSGAFLFVSLQTGSFLAVLSDQPPSAVGDIVAMISDKLFWKTKKSD